MNPFAAVNRGQCYACIHAFDNNTAEPTTDSTPRELTAWDGNGGFRNMTGDYTSNHLMVVNPGAYMIAFTGSFKGGRDDDYTLEIYSNGVGSGFKTNRRTETNQDEAAVSLHGPLTLNSGDTISIYHSTSNGNTFKLTQGCLTAHRIAD